MTDVTIIESVTTVSVAGTEVSVSIVEPVTSVTIVQGLPAPDPEASYDADAETLFAAMSSEPDDTRKQLISDTIVSLKASGIWDELDELWMLAAHNEQAGLLGWKRYKDCLAVNAPVFTTDRGFTGDGSTSYLNTQFVPSTDGVNYTQDDASFGVYNRTGDGSGNEMATSNASFANLSQLSMGATAVGGINLASATGRVSAPITDTLGLLVVRRSGAAAQQVYKNGVSIDSNATASGGLATVPFFVLAFNNNGPPTGFSNRQYAMAFVGASLSAGQQNSLYSIVQSFLTSIGAQV